MTRILRAKISQLRLKGRAFIAQDEIGSGKKADFVDPLPRVILQFQIMSVEHSGRVRSCVCQGGKRPFKGWRFDNEPRGNVGEVGQIWFSPTDF
jgi:hypothetical protein